MPNLTINSVGHVAINSVGAGRLALLFCFFSLGGLAPPNEKNEKNKANLPGPTELIAKCPIELIAKFGN